MTQGSSTGTARVKRGMAEMLKGGVIMDVVDAEQAKIAEDAGAVAVMALERHHSYRASILGDFCLFGVDNIHDDAALKHFGHTSLNARGACRRSLSHARILLRGHKDANLGSISVRKNQT